jgi:predicted DNA-binding transcriptional regulator YafY
MDRLVAIVIALQQRPETAQSLADKFEVSRRTILRDMQALAEMGVPVWAESGPAGGFRLMEGYRLPPLQLDRQEALTVLLALRALTRLSDTPFRQARWTAIDKIRAILPKPMLEAAEPVLDRVEIDMPRRKVKTPLLPELTEHAAASRWIRADYRSARSRRWLELLPRRVYAAHGFWYCEAYSAFHGETRTFRVDRMMSIEPIDGPAAEPERGASSGTAEPERGKAPGPAVPERGAAPGPAERAAGAPSVRIVARLTYRGALLAEQDEHIGERVRQIADDEWEVDFHCPEEEWNWAVRFFYALGTDAEVTEPERLRREIAGLARRVCERYGRSEGEREGTGP